MLVEETQDLRAFSEDWHMLIFQMTDKWVVALGRESPDYEVFAKANNPKRAFRDAMKLAKAYEEKRSTSLEKSS